MGCGPGVSDVRGSRGGPGGGGGALILTAERLRAERELLGQRPAGEGRRRRDHHRQQQDRREDDREPMARAQRRHRIVTGVPTGISRASLVIAALRRRMQPWEMRPGTSCGESVPWIPMNPPAGQSVSCDDRALVPNATGPYSGLAYLVSSSRT